MASATLIDDHASPETRDLYARLAELSAQPAGPRPELAAFELGGIEALAGHNLDGVAFPKLITEAREAHAAGRLVTLTWHSVNPLTHGGAGDNRAPLSAASVLPRGRVHEKYVKWLGNVAMLIEQLTDASSTPLPLIFAPFPGHDTDRFWWSLGDGSKEADTTADEFVALWRFTVEYLRDVARLHNVVWTLAPASTGADAGAYPGEEFVDLIAIAGDVDAVARAQLVERHGKPVISLGSKA